MVVLTPTTDSNPPAPAELPANHGPKTNGNGHYMPKALQDSLRDIVNNLITEDDTPVDNLFSEKQQRLLTESLFSSWQGPGNDRPFVAMANVGMYYHTRSAPLVPDVLLSIDVQVPDELWEKSHRCYMIWEYGKSPDIVIEIVSNKVGEEDDEMGKLRKYALANVPFYVIFDPLNTLKQGQLRVYERSSRTGYTLTSRRYFDDVGLALRLWDGPYEGVNATWLRWYDRDQNPIPTGAERANIETKRANTEATARYLAEQRIAELEAKLAALSNP